MSEIIDAKSGLARVGGSESLYKKLLAKFEGSVDMAAFDTSIATKDYVKAGEIVHAAKGVAGNLSLTDFFEHSSKLMEQLRGGGTPVDSDVQIFKTKFRETVTAINEYLS
jgi:HPt (histidine-containing phosphotransfer) domain-containing protein